MNLTSFSFLTAILFGLSARGNNNADHANHAGHDSVNNTHSEAHAAPAEESVKQVAVTYPQIDASIAASIKESVDHYLHVKNALASDNAAEAAKGAEAMSAAFEKMDKSRFTPEQKEAYDKAAGDLKKHAAEISKSRTDIKTQREHFVMLSEGVYALAKAFGGGRTLYHDHCPMAKNNEGAMWLSENKEIRNPYFGAEMLECSTVEEEIKTMQP